jgi:hypothetical protein
METMPCGLMAWTRRSSYDEILKHRSLEKDSIGGPASAKKTLLTMSLQDCKLLQLNREYVLVNWGCQRNPG